MVKSNRRILRLLNSIEAEKGRRRFRDFVRIAWPTAEPSRSFIPNWHIDAIADHLQGVTEGKIKRLLITVPPGHGKSLLVSVLWPAWQWTRNPKLRGIFTAYDGGLATRDSVRCRGLLASEWYQRTFRPAWTFADDQNEKSWYENSQKGFRMAFGVGGKGTGFRGDYLVVDDPLNAKKQHSEAALNEVRFWFDQVMSSRLNEPSTGSIVIIMQRLSERDLAAHVLVREEYVHLNLPTEFEPETCSRTPELSWQDPRTRDRQLLFPGLFPAEVIQRAKVSLGSQGFAAQHQQRPAPAEGGIFKRHWWKLWRLRSQTALPAIRFRDSENTEHEAEVIVLPDYVEEMIQSWDCAFKDSESSDYVVGQLWGREGADVFLMDQVRDRHAFPETLAAVRQLSAKWPAAQAKLIEDKANGSAVIQTLAHLLPGIIAVEPLGGKVARAAAVSPRIEAGNVYLPHPAICPWVYEFIEECANFPFGRHDDQVDAMSQALARLNVLPLVQQEVDDEDDEEPVNFFG
jgi:predicted phage terminase large subunit-like protein